MSKPRELSPKELAFCREYVIDHNATQGAIRAGYSRRTAQEQSSRLLSKAIIRTEVLKLEDEIKERLCARAVDVRREWTNLGFSDPGDLVWKPGELDSQGQPTREGAVKPLHEMSPEVRRTIKKIKFDILGRPEIEQHAKDPSLNSLGKNLKLLNEKVDVNLSVSLDKIIEQSYQGPKE